MSTNLVTWLSLLRWNSKESFLKKNKRCDKHGAYFLLVLFCPSLYTMKANWTYVVPQVQRLALRIGSLAIWLGILPFFLLCFYAHPSADDFLQANDVSKHGHWGYLRYMYLHWTGRYTAMLAWSFFNPVSYGQEKTGYGLVCLLLLVLFLIAIVTLIHALLRGAGLTTRQLWQAGAGALLLITFQLPSTAEYFYWLTSSFNYLMPGILLLLSLAALSTYAYQESAEPAKRIYLVIASVLLFLIVGCNESIAVPILLTTWGYAALESLRQRRLVGLGIVLVVGLGCAMAFLAPGNIARTEEEQNIRPDLITSAGRVVVFMSYCLVNWFGNGILLVVTLLLTPVFARFAQVPHLPLNQVVQHRVFLTLLIPTFLAAGLLPAFVVTGNPPPPRAQDLLYQCLIINWFLAAYAWVFYFTHKPSGLNTPFQLPAFVRWSLLAWLPLTFLTDYNHHLWDTGYRFSTNNSLLAYRDLLHGRAARYDKQLTARYHYLRTTWSSQVEVTPLITPPITVFFSDISRNPDNWDNRAYADFFGKSSIVLQADTTANKQ